jgi:mono/diheme cytochrome c family protein
LATGGEADPPSDAKTPPNEGDLIARGKGVYMGNCIACHNTNPAKDGTLGPAIAGSSRALLEARVINGTYPDGYTPKRGSQLMIPLPHLSPELDALTAYLDSTR